MTKEIRVLVDGLYIDEKSNVFSDFGDDRLVAVITNRPGAVRALGPSETKRWDHAPANSPHRLCGQRKTQLIEIDLDELGDGYVAEVREGRRWIATCSRVVVGGKGYPAYDHRYRDPEGKLVLPTGAVVVPL